jgi:SNF2 family DNA or RNA helicase
MNTADKANRRPATKEELYELIDDSDEYAIGCLMTLFSLQTADEQMSHSTREDNTVGFNMIDAGIMTNIAKFYERAGFLTPKQLTHTKRTVKKYHRQLLTINVTPRPIKGRPQTNGVSEGKMWAGMSGGGNEILAKFQFPKGDPRFQETLDLVKKQPGRRWQPDVKGWTMPLNIGAYEVLIEAGFDMADKLKEWYAKITAVITNGEELEIPGLKMALYPFQRAGVAFAESREGRALIADEMGLGKTAQALAWLQLNKETALPALAVVPASVKINWARECAMWTDIPTTILSGRNGDGTTHIEVTSGGANTLTIINYDIMDSWVETLKRSGFKTLIIDEVHYTKNSKAKRTKAVKKLASKIDHVLALSGTPIINRPIEFWNCLNMIRKDLFPSYHAFGKKYCDPTRNIWAEKAMLRKGKRVQIWDYKGASNMEELHNILTKTIMVRRKKEDVLTELPPKVRSAIALELSNWAEYEDIENEFRSWVADEYDVHDERPQQRRKQNAEALVRIEKLKQAAAKGKMSTAIEWIDDYLETTGGKLVVFATHHKVIDELVEYFKDHVGTVKLDGRDNPQVKQAAVDIFQNNPEVRLFVGNIKAAGIGITLHAAAATCFVELGWTPGEHDQAEDRIHRIGQEADSVSAYYLLAANTIEEEITALLDQKREVLDMVLDGQDVDQDALLTELLRKYDGRN